MSNVRKQHCVQEQQGVAWIVGKQMIKHFGTLASETNEHGFVEKVSEYEECAQFESDTSLNVDGSCRDLLQNPTINEDEKAGEFESANLESEPKSEEFINRGFCLLSSIKENMGKKLYMETIDTIHSSADGMRKRNEEQIKADEFNSPGDNVQKNTLGTPSNMISELGIQKILPDFLESYKEEIYRNGKLKLKKHEEDEVHDSLLKKDDIGGFTWNTDPRYKPNNVKPIRRRDSNFADISKDWVTMAKCA